MNLDFDEEEVNFLGERIHAYDLLKRKYGGSTSQLLIIERIFRMK